MNYEKYVGHMKSSNQTDTITYFEYVPKDKEIKALIQLVHGMSEYVERYEPLIEYLTGLGFLVYGDDHLGHKNSVRAKKYLGYFAPKDGWKYLVRDEVNLTKIMKEKYPDKKRFLYGHSMGSFISRAYIAQNSSEVSGAILSGTAGSNPSVKIGMALVRVIRFFKGELHVSKLIDFLMFGSYNCKYPSKRTNVDWLTRDEACIDRYLKDENCGFSFTTSGYLDLMKLLSYVTNNKWYDHVPAQFPLFVISGQMDPVGNWGKGLKQVDEKMRKTKRADYQMKLYPNMRHELHNEIDKEEVWQDVSNWLLKHC